MRKAALSRIDEQHADVEAAGGFQRAGGGVRHVAHLVGNLPDPLPCLPSDVLLAVEGFAYRGDGHTAGLCNVLHRNHVSALPYT